MKVLEKIIFLIILFFIPVFSSAQIIFSEIMYDPAGTDAGYEWVEIKNTYNYSLSLEKYKFCEGKPGKVSCRSWAKDKNDNFQIESGAFAIITDDREKFLEKNSFDGLILVSNNFVLTNTGEKIEIKNPDGNLDDSLIYNPDSGKGDGDTLSIFDELWKNSQATPGQENILKSVNGGDKDDDDEDEYKTNTSYTEVTDKINGKKKLRAEIDEVGTIMAGARSPFFGRAYGITAIEIYGIDFIWNFGNGSKDYGQKVYHTFDYPGEYIINLTVKSGRFTGDVKKKIKVISPPVEISESQERTKEKAGFVKIKNNSNEVLNLGKWIIQAEGDKFVIPEKTFIDSGADLIFSNKITNLRFFNNEFKKSKIVLYFPSGERLFVFDPEKKERENQEKLELLNREKEQDLASPNPALNIKNKKSENFKKQKITSQFSASLKTKKIESYNKVSRQEANILGATQNRKGNIQEIILSDNNSFIKNNWWLFLLSLFFLLILILIVYFKSTIDKNEAAEENKKEDYYESLDKEAEGFELEEVK